VHAPATQRTSFLRWRGRSVVTCGLTVKLRGRAEAPAIGAEGAQFPSPEAPTQKRLTDPSSDCYAPQLRSPAAIRGNPHTWFQASGPTPAVRNDAVGVPIAFRHLAVEKLTVFAFEPVNAVMRGIKEAIDALILDHPKELGRVRRRRSAQPPSTRVWATCWIGQPRPAMSAGAKQDRKSRYVVAHNGEVEGPPSSATEAPRAHNVFQRPRRAHTRRSRTPPTIVSWRAHQSEGGKCVAPVRPIRDSRPLVRDTNRVHQRRTERACL
jgi:hypothetical protein